MSEGQHAAHRAIAYCALCLPQLKLIIEILTAKYADYFYNIIHHTIKNAINPTYATPISFADMVYGLI